MRLLAALVTLSVLAAAGALASAEAARKPTPKERIAIGTAVILQVPSVQGQTTLFVVRRIVVSTVEPGARAPFTRFAAASGFGKDESGVYPEGPRTALVGLHRRTGRWTVVDYGVRRVGCRTPQSSFGGRRTTILRDLGIRCG